MSCPRRRSEEAIREVSGRKGFGVKADDLIDRLETAALSEVPQRHAEMNADEQKRTAHAIAVGALRFFLLKFTRNAIIAFDFADALSFGGRNGAGTASMPGCASAEFAAKARKRERRGWR